MKIKKIGIDWTDKGMMVRKEEDGALFFWGDPAKRLILHVDEEGRLIQIQFDKPKQDPFAENQNESVLESLISLCWRAHRYTDCYDEEFAELLRRVRNEK